MGPFPPFPAKRHQRVAPVRSASQRYPQTSSRGRGGAYRKALGDLPVACSSSSPVQGNIEYKLKLTSISNARFARLVTQLKWRLLEGGGQAYYELGVADSGALIGLSRPDLEESLETLEMMAGEIGASVIVVKEIEVPPTIAALADKDSGYTDPDTGEWTRKMRRRPHLTAGLSSDGDTGGEYCSPSATSTTELDTDFDFSAAELTDIDDFTSSVSSAATPGIATPASVTTSTATTIAHRHIRTHPSRPTAQSSPFIAPLDDDLALFSMEPEPAFRDEDDGPLLAASGVMADDELDVPGLDSSSNLGLDLGLGPRRSSFAGLEIAAVYKPRPIRHRTRPGAAPLGPTPGRHGKRLTKNKERKVHPWHQQGQGMKGDKGAHGGPPQISKEEKALQRRLARDKKREDKRIALIALAQGEQSVPAVPAAPISPPVSPEPAKELSLPVDPAVEVHSSPATTEQTSVLLANVDSEADALVYGLDGLHAAVAESPEVSPVLQARALASMDITVTNASELERGPRLIVEALVVRKMSIEEATLDFSRLALI